MKPLTDYPLSELKHIYRILHAALPGDPDLMDSDLLHDLQKLLQQAAHADGVDVSHHAQWAAWLGAALPLSCVKR
jgi:hypothetical protein